MTASVITLSLLVGAIVSLILRISQMKPARTKPATFVQHAGLAMGLFASIWLPPDWSKAAIAGGVCIFLLMGSGRWRNGAPKGTDKASFTHADEPIDLTARQWPYVAGGRK